MYKINITHDSLAQALDDNYSYNTTQIAQLCMFLIWFTNTSDIHQHQDQLIKKNKINSKLTYALFGIYCHCIFEPSVFYTKIKHIHYTFPIFFSARCEEWYIIFLCK